MGQAGEGAQWQAERAAEAVEAARRKLAAAEQRQRAWLAGAEGERRTGEALATLTAQGWVTLHDLHWPGRPFANIDHVAVGPGGVFVIDSKNWAGRVEVTGGVLRHNGYRRDRECHGVAAAAAAVTAWLEPGHRTLAVPLICLVGHATPTGQPPQATVCGLTALADVLRARPARLSPDEVTAIAGHLARVLSREHSPSQVTTAALAAAGPAPREAPVRTRARPGPARRPAKQTADRDALASLAKLAFLVFVLIVVAPAVLSALA